MVGGWWRVVGGWWVVVGGWWVVVGGEWVVVGTPPKWRHPQVEGGGRQALWDLETTMTTFNNNFILRASLEQAK